MTVPLRILFLSETSPFKNKFTDRIGFSTAQYFFHEYRQGVLPDVTITENIQDILDKKDRQMEWVMKKIGNNKNGN
jgi:hypothetical protein